MKKSALWLAMAAVALGFTATSCSDDPDHPDKNVIETPMMQAPIISHDSAVLAWKKCANANMYVYQVNDGPEMMSYEPTVTLTGLQPETTYSFKVKARRDYSEYFEDSEYTSLKFTTIAKPEVAVSYHIATYGDEWDTWFYQYNPDWTVKRVYRTTDGTANGPLDREWNFAYDGKNVQVTGKNEYTITLNDMGYVEKMIDGSKTYDYIYDEEGHMIECYKDGESIVKCQWQDGNLMQWSKIRNDADAWKIHTYDATRNVGGIHAIYAEGTGPSRWFVETGMFGKACANLHSSNQWDYSEKGSTFTFDFDANGCVTAEYKLYGEDIEPYYYTWTN